jgi:hypothetical protein
VHFNEKFHFLQVPLAYTPSRKSRLKWIFKFSAEAKRWMISIAPRLCGGIFQVMGAQFF